VKSGGGDKYMGVPSSLNSGGMRPPVPSRGYATAKRTRQIRRDGRSGIEIN
jgi:hypothetical protein